MAYVDFDQLADRPGAEELAQAATPRRYKVVDSKLLDALLRGESLSAWPADEVIIATETLDVIRDARTDADGIIDGFLVRRGYKLPLKKRYALIIAWSRAITRYFLHKDRLSTEPNDPIVRDYKDALAFLKLVAEGKFSLGEDDDLAPPDSGSTMSIHPPRIFTSETLKGY